MTLKQKKNLIWLLVAVALVAVVAVALTLRIGESNRLRSLQAEKEARRLFNAQTMRASGIGGRVVILDGDARIAPGIIADAASLIKIVLDQDVDPADVAMWVDEPNAQLILTADKIYYIENGNPFQWNLSELKTVDWERSTGGDVFIGNARCHILVECRKPFVEAMKKILINCRPVIEDDKQVRHDCYGLD